MFFLIRFLVFVAGRQALCVIIFINMLALEPIKVCIFQQHSSISDCSSRWHLPYCVDTQDDLYGQRFPNTGFSFRNSGIFSSKEIYHQINQVTTAIYCSGCDRKGVSFAQHPAVLPGDYHCKNSSR